MHLITDIGVSYEHDGTSLSNAWRRKVDKYHQLAESYRVLGYHVDVGAVIVGALGTWLPQNDGILRLVGMRDSAIKLLKRHCVSAALDGSRQIYFTHVMGSRYSQAVLEASRNITYLSTTINVA
jgi:hypothetical protein